MQFEFPSNNRQPGLSSSVSKSLTKKDLFQWSTAEKGKTFFIQLGKTGKQQKNITHSRGSETQFFRKISLEKLSKS